MRISYAADLPHPLNTYRQCVLFFQFVACSGNTDVFLFKVKRRKDKVKQNVKNPIQLYA